MGLYSRTKWLIRVLFKFVLLIIFLSLPVTFFPILAGIEGGLTFHFWNSHQVYSHSMSLQAEADMRSFQNYFDMPASGLSIHEYFDQRGPFHIPSLKTLDWLDKMAFDQPLGFQGDGDQTVDLMASFEGLVRNKKYRVGGNVLAKSKTQFWVFVSSLPEWMGTDWDEAFSQILQETYVTPLPDNVMVYYLDCASSAFLCGVWNVKSPSLLHFQVEDESLAERKQRETEDLASRPNDEETSWLDEILPPPEYTYNAPEEWLHPVTVRMIELPLEAEYAANLLPRGTLPTPALQLRTILQDPNTTAIASKFEEWESVSQLLRRFNDHHTFLSERYHSWRWYYTEADKWYSDTILEPIFGRDFTSSREGFMVQCQGVVFTLVVVFAGLIRIPCNLIWNLYAWYFGLGYDGEPLPQTVLHEEDLGGANMWTDMMDNFLAFVAQNMSAEASKSAAKAAITPD